MCLQTHEADMHHGGPHIENFLERITILSADEINSIYSPPCLSEEEQCLYFAMDAEEYAIAHSHRSVDMKILFILQLGYFKAKKLFFNFTNDENKNDIQFIRTNISQMNPS